MSKVYCKECKYSGEDTDEYGNVLFVCRKNAPTKLHGSGTGYEHKRWPIVTDLDWCGEGEQDE